MHYFTGQKYYINPLTELH